MPDERAIDIVDADAFAARLEALGAPQRFALAVSGGRDSMALAVLARDYAKATGADIAAFTVDHGLREGSDETAHQCAEWCEALGFQTSILNWRGDKPASGVQAAAREARYRLLAAACERHGHGALLTAHSADDQAETVFMRLRRGAGTAGLSAMADVSRIAAGAGAPLRLLRPLLSFTRARLTATVKAAGQGFIDDPANDDPTFERVRVRALLAALGEQDLLTVDALGRTAVRLEEADRRLRDEEERLFARLGGCFYGWGGATLDRISEARAMGGLAARLIHAVSGEDHGPGARDALAALRAAQETGAATLAGALVKRAGDRIWFMREPGAILGRAGVAPIAPIEADGPTLWDGRFVIRPALGGKTLSIEPVGRDVGVLGARRALFNGPDEAVMGAPALYRDGVLIGVADISFQGGGDFACQALCRERFAGEIIRFS